MPPNLKKEILNKIKELEDEYAVSCLAGFSNAVADQILEVVKSRIKPSVAKPMREGDEKLYMIKSQIVAEIWREQKKELI